MSTQDNKLFSVTGTHKINPDLSETDADSVTTTRFPCQQCGALLTFKIGSDSLQCHYCGHENEIIRTEQNIVENDLHTALLALDNTRAGYQR